MGLLVRVLRTDQPESSKRAMALLAGITLCFCLVVLTFAAWYQAMVDHAVDSGLVTALGLISATVGALAGVAYRKPEPLTGGGQ